MDLTHFEESHHEGLLVIRAVSAHQACGSGVDVDSFKANQSMHLFIPQKLIPVATTVKGYFLVSQVLIIKNECEEEIMYPQTLVGTPGMAPFGRIKALLSKFRNHMKEWLNSWALLFLPDYESTLLDGSAVGTSACWL